MNMTGRFLLICISIFAALSIKADAAEVKMDEACDTAALRYEYLVFRSTDAAIQNQFLIEKARVQRRCGDHTSAKSTLDRLNFGALNDSMTSVAHSEIALTAYLMNDYTLAESHLYRLKSTDTSFRYSPDAGILFTLVLNELGKWDEAKQVLLEYAGSRYSGESRDSVLSVIGQLYQPSLVPRLKNLKKAQIMSMIVPGSGQIYAGYVAEGITNSILVLAAVAYTGYSVFTANYLAAAFIGYGMMSKFYLGGITHLEYLVSKRNAERSRVYNDQLKELVFRIKK